MTSDEVGQIIEGALAVLPERMSGNEANQIVANRLSTLLENDRSALVDCLRNFLSFRVGARERTGADAVPEARIWLALHLAKALKLHELRPDIEALSGDVRRKLVFLPVYEAVVDRYLEGLSS